MDTEDNKGNETAGIVIKQKCKEDVSAVVINKWVPFSSVIAEGANLFLTYRDNHFAVTDGRKWNWLIPGMTIELSREVTIKVDKM